jgi:hypothetical protein
MKAVRYVECFRGDFRLIFTPVCEHHETASQYPAGRCLKKRGVGSLNSTPPVVPGLLAHLFSSTAQAES